MKKPSRAGGKPAKFDAVRRCPKAAAPRRPVKKIGLTINILERTVTVSGLSVFAHVDSADDVNILFGGESTIPGDLGVTGSIDRVSGEAWYLTFTKGKDKKVNRREMFDLVCKRVQ